VLIIWQGLPFLDHPECIVEYCYKLHVSELSCLSACRSVSTC